MSMEKENLPSLPPAVEKKSKKLLSYTREFLLSLSELDVCKKLPIGFDASILSELEDSSSSTYERRPHNRLEGPGSYPRGSQGRWETRSSGSSDKDVDLQSDREPLVQDTGRRFGNQTRRFWPNSEHDGLLGSGVFPRPSGYTGNPATKARGNDHYQLNKSSEPYHPPRPYKAVPYSRKDFTDSHNDETFGYVECSSEDRAEEERKRRASFELMRKEQQKALQEKHKANPEDNKRSLDVDMFAMLGNSNDGKNIRIEDQSDESVVASVPHNDSCKSSLHIQGPTSRPIVPPGFASALLERNIPVQSSSTPHTLEAGTAFVNSDHSLNCVENDPDKNSPAECAQFNMHEKEAKAISDRPVDANENLVAPTSSASILKQALASENVSSVTTCIHEAAKVLKEDIVKDFLHKNEVVSEIMPSASQDHSTTILEKFRKALPENTGNLPTAFEHQVANVDEESRIPEFYESSMFAHWSPEEGKKPIEDSSSRDLLSLIVSKEKVNSQVSSSPNEGAIEPIPPGLPFENIKNALNPFSFPPTSSVVRKPEQYSQVDKKIPSSTVLTCEDLEQSMLAEATVSSRSLEQPSIQRTWAPFDGKLKEQEVNVDDHASEHLLSLLQKGTSLKESVLTPGPGHTESSGRIAASSVKCSLDLHTSDNVVVRNTEMDQNSEQNILETIFGPLIMQELQSAEAPVSAKRGLVGTVDKTDTTQPLGLQFPLAGDSFFSSISPEFGSNKITREQEMLVFNHTQKNDNISTPWVGGYSDTPIDGSKIHGMSIEEGGAVDIQLPEEDNLITVGDTLKPIASDPFSLESACKSDEFLHGSTVADLNGRLLGAILRDAEHQRTHVPEGPPSSHNGPFENAHRPEEFLHGSTVADLNDRLFGAILREGERPGARVLKVPPPSHNGPLEMIDSDSRYNHLQGRPSLQYPHQMNQMRPLFPPLDHFTPRNAHMKFVGPDGLQHDPRHFPGNVIPHHSFSSIGAPGFDPAVPHHPMLHQMPVPRNFPPHHPMQGFPGGMLSSHPLNHMAGHVPERNNIHNFSGRHRQPNYDAGFGMGLPGSVAQGSGSRHPEALKSLIEMEIRANSKHTQPAVGGHIPGPGIYNPDLNMNFRYP